MGFPEMRGTLGTFQLKVLHKASMVLYRGYIGFRVSQKGTFVRLPRIRIIVFWVSRLGFPCVYAPGQDHLSFGGSMIGHVRP